MGSGKLFGIVVTMLEEPTICNACNEDNNNAILYVKCNDGSDSGKGERWLFLCYDHAAELTKRLVNILLV